MERNCNHLQVEILSASNVLSPFPNTSKTSTSYLSNNKAMAPPPYDIQKGYYGSPKGAIPKQFPEDHQKNPFNNRGNSLEANSSLIRNREKKEPENCYFLRSPLIMNGGDSQNKPNATSFNYTIPVKRQEFDQGKNLKSFKTDLNNKETTPTQTKPLLRNNSMNKLSNQFSETQNTQNFKKIPNDVKNLSPKTFLFSPTSPTNTTTPSLIFSPKQAKMEKVYDKIKYFQTSAKKKNEASAENGKILNETSNMVKTTSNRELLNKAKNWTPNPAINTGNSQEPLYDQNYLNRILARKKENKGSCEEEERNKGSNMKVPLKNNFLKENDPNEQRPKEKDNEENSEYKRLQEKLNLLEKKILSIKSNYDSTIKRNNEGAHKNVFVKKANDFVSSSCNLVEKINEKCEEKTKNVVNQKSKKNSLEIKSSNLKYISSNDLKDVETSKRTVKKKEKDENSGGLNGYVTQVKPHSLFPNNVYEEMINKNLNISEISIKGEGSTNTNSSRNAAARNENILKGSILKAINNRSDIYYVSSVIKSFFFTQKIQECEIWKEHFHQTMQAVLFTKLLKVPEEESIEGKRILLSKKEFYKSKFFFL